MLDDDTKNEVTKIVRNELRSNFNKKIGDIPTDALQLTPKKYVDTRYYVGIVAADGTATSLPSGWTSSNTATGQYTVTHNLNLSSTTYGVMVTLTGINTRATSVVLSANHFDVSIGNAGNTGGENNPFNFTLSVIPN